MKTIILNHIARTLFVSAWADWNDEYGNTNVSGKELMDVAPSTPDFMKEHAEKVLNGWLEENNISWETLVTLAKKTWRGGNATDEEIMDELGYCLAMESMGHGVSWMDDNEDWGLDIFHYDFGYYDIPASICPVPEGAEEE